MKQRFVFLIAAALTAVMAGSAMADTATQKVDNRQAKQRVRIAQGVKSGELTRAEAKRLRNGQKKVRRMERRAKADGVVTKCERKRLDKAQNRESRAIRRLKKNDRNR